MGKDGNLVAPIAHTNDVDVFTEALAKALQ
jgi:hypothetical protein